MGWAILRGSKNSGYRTSEPLECPHCAKPVPLAARAAEDKRGPHLVLWPVSSSDAGYTARELDYVVSGPPGETGVAMPRPAPSAKLIDDPVPDFSGDRS
jgi:hypothetical protein